MKKKGNGKQESVSVKNTASQLDLRKLYQSFLIDQRCNGNSLISGGSVKYINIS